MKLKHTEHRKSNIFKRKHLIANQEMNNLKKGSNNFAIVSGGYDSLLKSIWKLLKLDGNKKEKKSNDQGNRASRKFTDGIKEVAGSIYKRRVANRNT